MSEVKKVASTPELAKVPAASRPRVFARRFFPTFLRAARAVAPGLERERHIAIARAALAHAQVETDNGRALYCWNFGMQNVHPTQYVNGKPVVSWFPQGDWHPIEGKAVAHVARMRASRNENAGALEYLGFIKRHTPTAWRALTEGDPAKFYSGLRANKYFPGAFKNPDGTTTLYSDAQLDNSHAYRVRNVARDTADLEPPSRVGRAARFLLAVSAAAGLALAARGDLPLPRSLTA